MLKCSNLSYQYDDGTNGIENIDIDLDNKGIIGIVGANGAGKSTFYKCILGILKPTSGEVFYAGSPIKFNKRDLKKIRSKIGVVLQDPDNQIFYSKVYDDIAFGPRNQGKKEDEVKALVDESLSLCNCSHLSEKAVQYLSYGEKKRVSIAGILAMDFDVILFDEPEAGLDPSMKNNIKKLLKDLHDHGKKIVISSHDMDLIYELTDYVFVMSEGKIKTKGYTEKVFLDKDKIVESRLELPWLVKIHLETGVPLYKDENELFEFWRQ